ncbi:MAG TPA: RNA-binding protein, partial [Polyangiaceae bacterium]|nr:RNA-binding protein [Polyangiaceae bacterium]
RTEGALPKLHVTNLSSSATLASVRQLFSLVGDVLEIEHAAERNRSGSVPSVFVTMATLSAAEEAVRKLHGRLFHDRSMMVALLAVNEADMPRAAKGKPKPAAVTVAQQYRERQGMVYELDCSGLRLTVRFSFQDGGSKVEHAEARATRGSDFVVEATAASRELALVAVAEAWRQQTPGSPTAPELDWSAVVTALKAVRAV